MPSTADSLMLSTADSLLSVWICPHRALSYEEAETQLLYCPPNVGDDYVEDLPPCPKCSDHISTSVLHVGLRGTHMIALNTEIRLFSAHGYSDAAAAMRCFSEDRIALALATLDLPMCAHYLTSNRRVSRLHPCFRFQFEELGKAAQRCSCGPGDTIIPYHSRPCLECKAEKTMTDFDLIAREILLDGKRNLTLFLAVVRDLGSFQRRGGATSPSWTLHASLDTKRHADKFEKMWIEWLSFVDERAKGWGKSGNHSRKGSFRYTFNLLLAARKRSCTDAKQPCLL